MNSVPDKIRMLENGLDIIDLTLKHGLNFFNYESSRFLEELITDIKLSEGDIFYDIGSGYGIVLTELAKKFSKAKFIGIEIVKERADFSRELIHRSKLNNVTIINADFLDIDFSNGNLFFIFNPIYDFQYAHLLEKLEYITHPITVVTESKACLHFQKSNSFYLIEEIASDHISRLQVYKNYHQQCI